MKNRIIELLKKTNRKGMENLIEYMEVYGFFEAPCSGQYHLARVGGLAEHSLNVYEAAKKMFFAQDIPEDSLIICALLHDLGKMGQFGKANYIPNMLKGRATKANPNPEPVQSEAKPYITNPDLLYVDHEVRSVVIASMFIELTEEEQQAILWHNGLYGAFKYEIPGKETPLFLLVHWADMYAARVMEKGDSDEV
ncbi:MAG: HD domain-containing protein [Ruminococcus sp.]|nr:HD domain-containing protein [Ruminococcus sp.]